MALGGPFHERGVNGRTTKLETLVHSRQMADALLVAGVAAGAAAVGAVAVAATSRGRLARTRGQALAARTSLEAIERTSTEERRIRDTILSSMREGVLLVDRDGRCVFANDALVRHLGGSPASLDELFPTEIRRAARRAGYTGAANAVEVETGVPSRWLRANSQPIDGGGAEAGRGPTRLRCECIARAQDTCGFDPRRGGDPAQRRARGPACRAPVHRAAAARHDAAVTDRVRPPRPVPPRGRERSG